MVVRDVWGKAQRNVDASRTLSKRSRFFCSSKEFGLSFRMLLLSVVSFFLTFFLAVVAHFDAQREMLGLAT